MLPPPLALLATCLTCLPCRSPAQQAAVPGGLALNLTSVVDWGTEQPFTDLFTGARTWVSQAEGRPWGGGPPLALDDRGCVRSLRPGQWATTILLTAGGHRPGSYVCLHDGVGELQFKGNARVTGRRPGRYDLAIGAGDSLLIDLRATDPADPVRRIRILPKALADDASPPRFDAAFVARVRQFRAVRFMDWMATNNSEQRTWADRPRVDDATQSRKGVALEHMIALCNEARVAPWFCMPHLADDDYVEQFATAVKQQLAPGLPVWIEHSNEVWNPGFAQARHAAARGRALGLARDDNLARLRYHSRRSVEIFRIWERVFGGTQRLVRVLAAQFANQWGCEQVLDFESAWQHADALAVAPYFGDELGDPAGAGSVVSGGLDGVFASLRQDLAANADKLAQLAALAHKRHLALVAYEGGQHLVGHGGAENREDLTALFVAANRDRRMQDLYLEDLGNWRRAGGRLFALFSSVSQPSKWGSWGLLDTADQDPAAAPKYQAVLALLKQFPGGW